MVTLLESAIGGKPDIAEITVFGQFLTGFVSPYKTIGGESLWFVLYTCSFGVTGVRAAFSTGHHDHATPAMVSWREERGLGLEVSKGASWLTAKTCLDLPRQAENSRQSKTC